MPVIISSKDVEWRETDDKINIIVSLSSRIGVKPSILITSKYLKISSPPYLWESFLFSTIDVDQSLARIEDERITFDLQKTEYGHWNTLSDTSAGDEEYRKRLRTEAFEENRMYLEEKLQLKSKKLEEVRQSSVQKQMELDDLARKEIENRKKMENEKIAKELRRKKEQMKANMIAQKRKSILQKPQLPPTRASGHITVNFTPRVFPTAARESQEPEEKEWLEKQFEARKSLELDCADLQHEEKNPDWLKSKAESMLKRGDFRSAINAFSLAIRMCPNLYSLYMGRSSCHLNLRNLHKAIEDSSKALELLIPAVKSNAEARKEAHKIRGEAFHRLELHVEGLMDLDAAMKIDPKDEELKQKALKVKKCIENNTSE